MSRAYLGNAGAMDALILAWLQFAFTIGCHNLWPTFAIGGASWGLFHLLQARLSRAQPGPWRRAEEKDVPPRPWRLPARVGPALILTAAVAACATATPRLAPPAPATLAAVHGLAPHPCNPTTAGVLDALGVPPAAVRSIYYERPPTGSSHGTPAVGYTAWVRLADQPGDLVIRHDDWCGFVTSYTVGTVRLGTR